MQDGTKFLCCITLVGMNIRGYPITLVDIGHFCMASSSPSHGEIFTIGQFLFHADLHNH